MTAREPAELVPDAQATFASWYSTRFPSPCIVSRYRPFGDSTVCPAVNEPPDGKMFNPGGCGAACTERVPESVNVLPATGRKTQS